MTRDFPMLSPVFFTEALDAGDDFFLALDYAEDKAEAHEKAPDTQPKLTKRDFREVISERKGGANKDPKERRRSQASGGQTGSGEDPSPAGEPNPQPPSSEPPEIEAKGEPETAQAALERARELAADEGDTERAKRIDAVLGVSPLADGAEPELQPEVEPQTVHAMLERARELAADEGDTERAKQIDVALGISQFSDGPKPEMVNEFASS